MGVLGWTYDQTLDTPMPAIKAAINARNRFVNSILKAVFGEAEPTTPVASSRKLSPKLFDAMFGGRK